MTTTNKIETPPKAIFFDAAGTLFYLTKSVGQHYALVGSELGLSLDPATLDRALLKRSEAGAVARRVPTKKRRNVWRNGRALLSHVDRRAPAEL